MVGTMSSFNGNNKNIFKLEASIKARWAEVTQIKAKLKADRAKLEAKLARLVGFESEMARLEARLEDESAELEALKRGVVIS